MDNIENKTVQKWKCMRCGHEWYSRDPFKKPRTCAKCSILYWDRPARTPKPKHEPGPVGKPLKYPQLATLQVGDECFIEWPPMDKDGFPWQSRSNVNPTVMNFARKRGLRFVTTPESQGLRVKRVE